MPALAAKPPVAKPAAKATVPVPPAAPVEQTPPSPAAGDEAPEISNPLEFVPEPSSYSSRDPDGLEAPIAIAPPAPSPTTTPSAPAPPKELSPEEKKKLNSDLRAQLELANKSKAEIEEAMKKTVAEKDAELERLRKEREDFENRFKQTEERYSELNRTVSMERPELSQEVQELIAPWNREMDALAQDITVAGGDGGRFKSNLGKMIEMARTIRDPNADGFEEKRNAFNQMVNEFGPEHAKDVRRFVFNGIELQDKARSVMADLTKNASSIRQQRELQAFKAIVQDYEKDEVNFFNPAPEVKENDPLNAEVLVTELLSASDEGKKRMADIKKFARFALLPLPPVGDEIEKMSEEDAAAYLEQRLRNHQAAHVRLRKMFPIGQAAMALLPSLVKRNKELEDQIATLRGNTPAPRLDGEQNQGPAESQDDIRKFTPANPKLDELRPEIRR
jgi:flagellar motility protein MotE (MotC chaperone)